MSKCKQAILESRVCYRKGRDLLAIFINLNAPAAANFILGQAILL